MAYKMLSKNYLAKLLVTAVVASTSVGSGSVAFAATLNETPQEQAALAQLQTELQQIYTNLNADGQYSTVHTAQATLQGISVSTWTNWIFGTTNPSQTQQNFATAIKDMVALATYGSISGNVTADGLQFKADLNAASNGTVVFTAQDIYNLFESIKSQLELQAVQQLSTPNPAQATSYRSIIQQVISTALSNDLKFSQVMTYNGVTSSVIDTVAHDALGVIDPTGVATNAMVSAALMSRIAVMATVGNSSTPQTLTQSGFTLNAGSTATLKLVSVNLPVIQPGVALPSNDVYFSFASATTNAALTQPQPSDPTGSWTLAASQATTTQPIQLQVYVAGVLIETIPVTVNGQGSQAQSALDNSSKTVNYTPISVGPTAQTLTLQITNNNGNGNGNGGVEADVNIPNNAFDDASEHITFSSNTDQQSIQQAVANVLPPTQVPQFMFKIGFTGADAAPLKPITFTFKNTKLPTNAIIGKVTASGYVPLTQGVNYSIAGNGDLTLTVFNDPYFVVSIPSSQGNSGGGQGNNGQGNGQGTPPQVASVTNSTVNLSATSLQVGQPVTISGVVKDASSTPIVNRTVQVKFDDKTGVTVTGADGSYSVTLTPDKPITNGQVSVKIDQADISNSSDVITVAQPTVPTPQGPGLDLLKNITFNIGTFKVDSNATTFTKTVGSTTVQVTVPAGAFKSNGFVSVVGSFDPSVLAFSLNGFLPGGSRPEEAFGLLYSGDAPVVPLTLTVSSPTITSGATVFNVATGGATPAGSASNGSVTVSASSSPYFLVVQIPQAPVVTPPKQGPGPQSHNFTNSAVYVNGKKLPAAQTFVANKTAYMSISSVTQTLKSLGFTTKWDSKTKMWTVTAPKSAKVNFSSIKLNSGDVTIKLNGKVVYKAPEIVATDPKGNTNTFLPIWYVMQTLKRAGITSTWNGSTWKVTSKH